MVLPLGGPYQDLVLFLDLGAKAVANVIKLNVFRIAKFKKINGLAEIRVNP